MKKNQKTDIVTIAFEDDIRLTILQAISVLSLVDPNSYEKYTIILNGKNNQDLKEKIQKEALETQPLEIRKKVAFINKEDIAKEPQDSGWRDQQYLKLMYSLHTNSEFYLLLDSKNHFIKQETIDSFFSPQKIPYTHRQKPSPLLENWLFNCMKTFEVTEDSIIKNAMPTITPYVMHSSICRDLISEIESRYTKDFPKAFKENLQGCSEFFLYYSYMIKKFNGTIPENIYTTAPPFCITLFAKWPEDPNMAQKMLDLAKNSKTTMLGIHRLRIPQLNDQHKSTIKEIWRDAKINHPMGLDWFLSNP